MFEHMLFICYGNSCRSIMAEALTRHCWGDAVPAASAGIMPLGYITPHTLLVLQEWGVPVQGLYSKGIYTRDFGKVRLIVNLMDTSLGGLIPHSLKGRVVNRYVQDPFGGNPDEFRRTRDAIFQLVKEKIPQWWRDMDPV